MVNGNTPLQAFCNEEHRYQYAMSNSKSLASRAAERRQKAQGKKDREAKVAARPKSWYTKEAQKWFNKFIRLRDDKEPCISCQRHHTGQYHAGHYRTVGSAPELRYEEDNCHKQCSACNNHLSGNIVNYRPNLINKIGQERVDWLEGPHKPAKLSIDNLKLIIEKYKAKCKELS
jgi:hypothetical protein